jgi:hypothetical protein
VKRLPPLCLAALLAGCGSPQQVAGTASQTGNAVAFGRIALSGDTTKGDSGVVVHLRPLSWLPGDTAAAGALQTDTTDAQGRFRFEGVPVDTYRVEAVGPSLGWSRTFRATDATTTLPAASLSSWGRLKIEIDPKDSMAGKAIGFFGLDRQVVVPSSQHDTTILIDSLPVGLQSLIVYRSRSAISGGTSVRIGPDSTTKVDLDKLDSTFKHPEEDDDDH